MERRRKKKKTRNRRSQFNSKIVIITGVALLLIYLAGSLYYTWNFYNRTTINGVNCSNISTKSAEELISTQVREYTLTIEERDDATEQIKGEDIGLKIYFDGGLDSIKKKQNGFLWPIHFFTKDDYEIGTMLNYDKDLLESFYNYLNCFNEDYVIQPIDAHVSEYQDDGYTVVEETKGNLVKKDKLYEIIQNAVLALDSSVSIEKEDCYENPGVTMDNEALNNAVEQMNHLVSSKITYEFGDDQEVVDGEKIHKWINVDSDYNVSLNQEDIKEFIDYIGKTYNTFGKVRTLKTSYDKTIQVSGGDYGWWLDRTTELSELTKAIQAGTQGVREPVYFQTAKQYGDDDVGNTYVEINLTAQHLFFYKDGNMVVDSDFVSGNLTKNYGTPVGTYPIQYRQKDATLVGEDYETSVSYWMPFNGNIGMHDASWRSDFGKDIYLKSGSHGCINLPPKVAKTIYEGISKGTAVIVYELPGTENYTVGSTATEASEQSNETQNDNSQTNETTQNNSTTSNTQTN
ncbi:putative peptidoglycan binding protein [Lachnotalea glycerini]|uniref:Putative peptidoglycan binding protein n=1 Tax=Lachnotalea glycerini TaxID=1763509 RepID=A0A318EH51_9FIRM|nr:L,D-transpeptidase family protein [Lachnotalea glycerini]PXV85590.1 putative peptidoglycan binding protein [Lachnotalea glycerini]